MKKIDLAALSKTVSHALRHEPWLYELETDSQGWVPIEDLLQSLRSLSPDWDQLNEGDLGRMIAQSEKPRHEILEGRIRAIYGHSIPQRLIYEPGEPPAFLYHGTSSEAAEVIRRQGLKPMGRQYVHLSPDAGTAEKVGLRKSHLPVILQVLTGSAHRAGIKFYRGNALVWLADAVPAQFISR